MRTLMSMALIVAGLCAGGAGLPQAMAAKNVATEGIAVVVNEEVISLRDVNLRAQLIMTSSGLPQTDEIREKVTAQVINSLVEERLMLQEAARSKIKVSDEEINGGFSTLAQQNNMEVDEFKSIIKRQGISLRTMEDQIRAQIAWTKFIQSKLRPEVEISEYEINSRLERLKSSIGKSQYLVAEIFLAVDEPSADTEARQLAEQLTKEISQGKAPFSRVAMQVSQNAAAARGGDLGWILEGQLVDELDQTLAGMQEGEVSKPIRSLTGYHILMLRKKNTLQADNMPSDEDVYNQLGLEQLDRLQRRYLLDLKSTAFVDRRV